MPTVRQRKAARNVVENGGVVSTAMISAGYSEKTAINPSKLTRSKGWAELMDSMLSDSKLAAVHNKLLNKKEVLIISDGAKDGSHFEFTDQPHSDAAKALDMAYKLKRKYESEATNNNLVIVSISGEIVMKYGIKPTPIDDSQRSPSV
jgi:hypothetical protein